MEVEAKAKEKERKEREAELEAKKGKAEELENNRIDEIIERIQSSGMPPSFRSLLIRASPPAPSVNTGCVA